MPATVAPEGYRVSIPKRVLEALNLKSSIYLGFGFVVSIPKRVLEALNQLVNSADLPKESNVSIPKRVLEALNLP